MCSKLENLMEYWSNGTTLQSSEKSSSLLLSHLDIRCISTYFSKLHSIQYGDRCSLIHCKYIGNNLWIWMPMASNMLWVWEVWELNCDSDGQTEQHCNHLRSSSPLLHAEIWLSLAANFLALWVQGPVNRRFFWWQIFRMTILQLYE